MQVVNLSLSTGGPHHFGLFHELADAAYFASVMLVCAVNNVPAPSYPSQYASVFSVAAHPAGHDPFDARLQPAPAGRVRCARHRRGGAVGEAAGRSRATGNSFAARTSPGWWRCLLSKHPGLTPFQVKTVLHAVASNAVAATAT